MTNFDDLKLAVEALSGGANTVRLDDLGMQFEKPADVGAAVQAKRAAYGQGYYNKYAGKYATSATPSTPAAFAPYKVKVTGNPLNIRKGAGTNYAACGAITDKGVYTIVEEADGAGAKKWGKLENGAGWISLDYTKKQ